METQYPGHLKTVKKWEQQTTTPVFVMWHYAKASAVRIANYLRQNGYKVDIQSGEGMLFHGIFISRN